MNPDDMKADANILRVIDQDLYILDRVQPLPHETFEQSQNALNELIDFRRRREHLYTQI